MKSSWTKPFVITIESGGVTFSARKKNSFIEPMDAFDFFVGLMVASGHAQEDYRKYIYNKLEDEFFEEPQVDNIQLKPCCDVCGTDQDVAVKVFDSENVVTGELWALRCKEHFDI